MMMRLGVVGMSDLFHDCVKSIFLVRRIFNDTVGSIGFIQSVLALDDVAIAVLPLRLVIAGLGVFNAVFKLVGRVVVRIVLFRAVMLLVVLLNMFVSSIVMTWLVRVVIEAFLIYSSTYRALRRCVLRDAPTHLLHGVHDEQRGALGA